jgi:pimeloyl-ACP methyl ester carboxylesterase
LGDPLPPYWAIHLVRLRVRGVGLSDRVPEQTLPTLETRMGDLRAVMDAVGVDRAIVMGVSEGGPLAMLFAATYPRRPAGLVLFGTAARSWTPRSPREWGEFQESLDDIDHKWGTIEYARKQIRECGAPVRPDDRALTEWLASYLRRAASPGATIALERMTRR